MRERGEMKRFFGLLIGIFFISQNINASINDIYGWGETNQHPLVRCALIGGYYDGYEFILTTDTLRLSNSLWFYNKTDKLNTTVSELNLSLTGEAIVFHQGVFKNIGIGFQYEVSVPTHDNIINAPINIKAKIKNILAQLPGPFVMDFDLRSLRIPTRLTMTGTQNSVQSVECVNITSHLNLH